MITHFAKLQLPTVSVQGVKQFYHDQLRFPIAYETEREIGFKPTEHVMLSFAETAEPLAPAHIAFEVSFSGFDEAAALLEKAGIFPLKWPDGRVIDDFGTGKNVYFRDGDGNLLELIAHRYVKEGILPPAGQLNILYLREAGFPVDSVAEFRQLLVDLLDFNLDKVYDDFTFGIGGTAHAVIASKNRRWIPIAMAALPPKMKVTLGVSRQDFIGKVEGKLAARGIRYEGVEEGGIRFVLNGYCICLQPAQFPEEAPALLNLPYSRV